LVNLSEVADSPKDGWRKIAQGGETATPATAFFAMTDIKCSRVSSGELVTAMQASEPSYANNLRVDSRTLCRFAASRRILARAEMFPVIMVVSNVIRQIASNGVTHARIRLGDQAMAQVEIPPRQHRLTVNGRRFFARIESESWRGTASIP
jgi:hypothetical protein